jgi:hypothetical protein
MQARTSLTAVKSPWRFWAQLAVLAAVVWAAGCARAPAAPSAAAPVVDVLDYVIGPPGMWPRHGEVNHHQHQTLQTNRVCWNKYTLPWSFECWRWDDNAIYHDVDHAIDGARRWEFYQFEDGRWLPRWIRPGEMWSLEVHTSIHWFNAACEPLEPQAVAYRVRAWLEGPVDAGGDLGVRDTLLLEYTPNLAQPLSAERFSFAKGAGWYAWERGDGARVTFNRLGGVARQPSPLCERDFVTLDSDRLLESGETQVRLLTHWPANSARF